MVSWDALADQQRHKLSDCGVIGASWTGRRGVTSRSPVAVEDVEVRTRDGAVHVQVEAGGEVCQCNGAACEGLKLLVVLCGREREARGAPGNCPRPGRPSNSRAWKPSACG